MKKHLLVTTVAVLLFTNTAVLAQEDAPRFEIGGQFSLLARNRPSTQLFLRNPETKHNLQISAGIALRF